MQGSLFTQPFESIHLVLLSLALYHEECYYKITSSENYHVVVKVLLQNTSYEHVCIAVVDVMLPSACVGYNCRIN